MLNKIMLIGNLGRDPELNVTSDGTPVTRFSLAVSRNYKTSSGEKREETEWFNIVAWRQLAGEFWRPAALFLVDVVARDRLVWREGPPTLRTSFQVHGGH